MNPEKDISNRVLVGRSTLQVGNETPRQYDEYYLPPELPARDKKREQCLDHIREGAAAELVNDFDLAGVRYPESHEPQEITLQLSCKGVSCILKKCGLKIEQFDTGGRVVSEMKASS